MTYTENVPAPGLEDYVDAYWVRHMDAGARRVYADGCADIFMNVGDAPAYFYPTARLDEGLPLEPGRLYLGGTMSAYGVVRCEEGCAFRGIRFRPGGLFALYSLSMEETVDQVLVFPDAELRERLADTSALDAYLLAKRGDRRHDFASISRVAYAAGGNLSVEDLCRACHLAPRTLERVFKENVGIPPKEFLKVLRFQEALRRLRIQARAHDPGERSLLRLAFELGYYDHAHLTNEFKKYAGIRPSDLSRFYKTGISDGQYF